jgi:hypothetical protein
LADATKLPDLTEMTYFQWALPTASNPRLAAPISDSATTITFTNPPLDKSGAVVATAFMMGIRQKNGYVENVLVPAGGMSVDGLTATGCVRGIELEGIDYTTGDTSLAVSHNADEPVYCNISGVMHAITVAAMQGTIASGGANFRFGDETDVDITIYAANGDANEPYFRYDSATNQFIYSNDGISSTPFGTGAGVTGGDGITVTAGDIDIDTSDATIFIDTSNHSNDAFLEDMEYLADANIQTAWTESTDGNNPIIERMDVFSYNGVRYRSGVFGWTNAAGTAEWTYATSMGDLSSMTGAASGTPTKGRLVIWMKAADHTTVTAFGWRLGSAAGAYAFNTVGATVTSSGDWVKYEWDLATETTLAGTPDWTAVDYLRISVAETGSSNITVDSILLYSANEDYEKVGKINTEDYIEGKMVEQGDYDSAGVHEYATDTEIERGIELNAGLNNLVMPPNSKYARGEINNIVRIQGAGPITKGIHDALYISDGTGGRAAGQYWGSDNDDTTNEAMKFSGLFTGEDGTVRSQNAAYPIGRGVVGGFTGLTVGALYYVGASAGLISTSPPSPGRARICVGRAISATEIDTFDTEHYGMDSGVLTDVNDNTAGTLTNHDETITTAFRPVTIEVDYYIQGFSNITATFHQATGSCIWHETAVSNNYAQGLEIGGGGDNSLVTALSVNDPSSTADPEIGIAPGVAADTLTTLEINAVSNTGFTFRVVSNVGGTGNNSRFRGAYRAYGYTV